MRVREVHELTRRAGAAIHSQPRPVRRPPGGRVHAYGPQRPHARLPVHRVAALGWAYLRTRLGEASVRRRALCEPQRTFLVRPSPHPDLTAADSHVGDITPACFDCFENENIAAAAGNKEIVTTHAALLKEQFQRTTQHTGCPHPFGPDSSDEDLAAIRQSYAEGGERIPDQFL